MHEVERPLIKRETFTGFAAERVGIMSHTGSTGRACDDLVVRTMGWPYPFRQRPWEELDREFDSWSSTHPEFQHMSAIVTSVREAGAEDVLAASTSMHDLLVRPTPLTDPPYDVVAVRAPNSMFKVTPGTVLIEHLSVTGRNDRIVRPAADAVPLFWRFMIEKFGVDPKLCQRPS